MKANLKVSNGVDKAKKEFRKREDNCRERLIYSQTKHRNVC